MNRVLLRSRSTLIGALLLGLIVACSGPTSEAELTALVTWPDVIPLPDGFQPEGVVTGKGHELFAGSLADGSVYRIDLRTGEGALVVPAQAGRIAAGLSYDNRSGLLWVAGGINGAGHAYDPASGTSVASFAFSGGPTLVNDVVVTRTAAWFTDSFAPVLYKVSLSSAGLPVGGFEMVPLGGDFQQVPGFNGNGIVATPNGDTLVVVNTALGTLHTVEPASGVAHLIDLGGASVPFGDGLVLAGSTLYVVQNFLNQIAVVQLAPDLASGEVLEHISSAHFRIPATAAEFGSSLYVVNGRFDTPPLPTTAYEVVRIKKVSANP